MNILAIDPGTKSCGLAYFLNGQLVETASVKIDSKDSEVRILYIVDFIQKILSPEIAITEIVCEDPLLQGRNNNTMQRFLGALNYALPSIPFNYIAPMTLKAYYGMAKEDKLSLANSLISCCSPSEKSLINEAIQLEAYDETDAAALGIMFLESKGVRRGNNVNRSVCNKTKDKSKEEKKTKQRRKKGSSS